MSKLPCDEDEEPALLSLADASEYVVTQSEKAGVWALKRFEKHGKSRPLFFKPLAPDEIQKLLAKGIGLSLFGDAIDAIRKAHMAGDLKLRGIDTETGKSVEIEAGEGAHLEISAEGEAFRGLKVVYRNVVVDGRQLRRLFPRPPIPRQDAPDQPYHLLLPAVLPPEGSETAHPPPAEVAAAPTPGAEAGPASVGAEPQAVLPEVNPGGRPTDRERVVEEARRRLSAKNANENVRRRLAPFCRGLRDWLNEQPNPELNSKTGEVMSVDTIEGHVRDMFWEFWEKAKNG